MFSCISLLSDDTAALLSGTSLSASAAQCQWVDETGQALQAFLTSSTSVEVGATLTLRANVICGVEYAGIAYSQCAGDASVTLDAAPSPLVPTAVIEGQTMPSVCDDVELNARRSSGAGVFALSYEWTLIDTSQPPGEVRDQIEEQLAESTDVFQLASELLPASLNVGLVVRNRAGGVSGLVNMTVTKASTPSLRVALDGGTSSRTVLSSEGLRLNGAVAMPGLDCIPDELDEGALSLEWRVVPMEVNNDLTNRIRRRRRLSEAVSSLDGIDGVPATLITLDSRRLDISAYVLAPNTTYSAIFTAASSSGALDPGSLTVTVHVGRSDVAVVIAGGAEVSMSRTASRTIDAASLSYDPDGAYYDSASSLSFGSSLTSSLSRFEWNCTAMSEIGSCSTSDVRGALATSNDAGSGTLQLGPFMSANEMLPGTRLRFDVRGYTSDGRSGTSSQMVEVVAGAPPQVVLDTPGQETARESGDFASVGWINPAATVSLIGAASSSTCASLGTEGTVESGCIATFAYSISDAVDGTSLSADAYELAEPGSAVGRPLLVLRAGALSAGGAYTVRLSVTDTAASATGFATASIRATQPPSAGTLVLEPAVATMDQFVTMRLVGANDPDGADELLTYRFWLAEGTSLTGPFTQSLHLAGPKTDWWHTTTAALPPGNLTLIGEAIDWVGSSGVAAARLYVALAADLRAGFASQLEAAEKVLDDQAGVQAVYAYATAFEEAVDSGTTTAEEARETLREMTSVLNETIPAADEDVETKQQFVSALSATMASWELVDQTQVEGSAEMLENVLATTDPSDVSEMVSTATAALSTMLQALAIAETSTISSIAAPPSPPSSLRRLRQKHRFWRRALSATYDTADDASEAESSELRMAAAHEAGRTLFATVSSLADTVLEQMSAGDAPRMLSGDAVQLGLFKDYPERLLNCDEHIGSGLDGQATAACCFDVLSPNSAIVGSARSRACIPQASFSFDTGDILSAFGVAYQASPLVAAQLDDYNASEDPYAQYTAPRYATAIFHQKLFNALNGSFVAARVGGVSYYWLSHLSRVDLEAADVRMGRTAFRCERDSDCAGVSWEPESAGVCNTLGRCVCPLPWGGASCSRQLSCRWFELANESWRGEGCLLNQTLSNGTHIVCQCSEPRPLVSCAEREPMQPAPARLNFNAVNLIADLSRLDPALLFGDDLEVLSLIVCGTVVLWAVLVILSKALGNEREIQRNAHKFQFWRAQHNATMKLRRQPWLMRTWFQFKTQHKLLRCFYFKFQVGQDPAALHTGAQKATVLASILLLKMLATAFVYRGGCDIKCIFAGCQIVTTTPDRCDELRGTNLDDIDPADDICGLVAADVPSEAGISDDELDVEARRILSGTMPGLSVTWEWLGIKILISALISIGMMPATVVLDQVFWKAQRVTNAHLSKGDAVSGAAAMARAAMQNAMQIMDVSVAWMQWKRTVEQMLVELAQERLIEKRRRRGSIEMIMRRVSSLALESATSAVDILEAAREAVTQAMQDQPERLSIAGAASVALWARRAKEKAASRGRARITGELRDPDLPVMHRDLRHAQAAQLPVQATTDGDDGISDDVSGTKARSIVKARAWCEVSSPKLEEFPMEGAELNALARTWRSGSIQAFPATPSCNEAGSVAVPSLQSRASSFGIAVGSDVTAAKQQRSRSAANGSAMPGLICGATTKCAPPPVGLPQQRWQRGATAVVAAQRIALAQSLRNSSSSVNAADEAAAAAASLLARSLASPPPSPPSDSISAAAGDAPAAAAPASAIKSAGQHRTKGVIEGAQKRCVPPPPGLPQQRWLRGKNSVVVASRLSGGAAAAASRRSQLEWIKKAERVGKNASTYDYVMGESSTQAPPEQPRSAPQGAGAVRTLPRFSSSGRQEKTYRTSSDVSGDSQKLSRNTTLAQREASYRPKSTSVLVDALDTAGLAAALHQTTFFSSDYRQLTELFSAIKQWRTVARGLARGLFDASDFAASWPPPVPLVEATSLTGSRKSLERIRSASSKAAGSAKRISRWVEERSSTRSSSPETTARDGTRASVDCEETTSSSQRRSRCQRWSMRSSPRTRRYSLARMLLGRSSGGDYRASLAETTGAPSPLANTRREPGAVPSHNAFRDTSSNRESSSICQQPVRRDRRRSAANLSEDDAAALAMNAGALPFQQRKRTDGFEAPRSATGLRAKLHWLVCRSLIFWQIYPWWLSLSLMGTSAFFTLWIGSKAFEGCPDLILDWWVTFVMGMLQTWLLWDVAVILVRNNLKLTRTRIRTVKYQTTEKVFVAPLRLIAGLYQG